MKYKISFIIGMTTALLQIDYGERIEGKIWGLEAFYLRGVMV
jgi:hypothetical protein